MERTVAFYTLGCKVNQYETNAMEQQFIQNGYKIVENTEKADIYVINTCTVTNMADRKSRQMLRRVKEINQSAVIVVCGCYAQVAKTELEQIPEVDIILGINEKNKIVQIVEEYLASKNNIIEVADVSKQKEFLDFGDVTYTEKNRAVIKVQDGCNMFCSYCLIPYARGRIRSRKIENVVSEIKKIAKQGIKEVVITGIHVASYGKDFENGNIRLINLLEEINKIEGIERIRFISPHPKDFTDDVIEAIRDCEKVCKIIHLPLQSGSTEILKRMNRKYTKEQYLALVDKMKAKIPEIVLSTDIIVGFPGETEEDFEDTLDVVSKVRFEQVYMFIYSRRVGTPADKMENQIPDEVKHERFDRLKKLAESQIEGNNQKYVNTIQKVLVEGKSKTNENMLTGRTETNKVVNFEGTDDMIGKIVNLKIVSEHMWYLKGEVQ